VQPEDTSAKALALFRKERRETRIGSGLKGISTNSSEKRIHLRLHGFIHLDERRTVPIKSRFARQFLCRVNAEFATHRHFAPAVVEPSSCQTGWTPVPLFFTPKSDTFPT